MWSTFLKIEIPQYFIGGKLDRIDLLDVAGFLRLRINI